jgi:hypothetical protein
MRERSLGMREGVWTHGHNTELEAWVAGESRPIAVTREAIEAYLDLSPEKAAAMTPEDRCQFVRDHLATVIDAAKRKMQPFDRSEDLVTIRTGEL